MPTLQYGHLPKQAGVYKIRNKINGKFYIGSTKNLRHRWLAHKCLLNAANRGNSKLKAAWIKYGEDSFEYEILSKCPEEYLIKLEQWFIDNLKPQYNTRLKAAASNKGIKHTKRALEKISAAGKKLYERNNGWLAERNKKPILCYNSNGEFVKEYDSAKGAALELNMFSTNITAILKGKNHINKGYHFRYKVGDIIEKNVYVPHKIKDVEIEVWKGNKKLGEFRTIAEAGKKLKIAKSAIYSMCSGAGTPKKYSEYIIHKIYEKRVI